MTVRELEPGLFELTAEPKVGIGQSAFVVSTDAGRCCGTRRVRRRRGRRADPGARRGARRSAPSHPHMFGAQLEWSRAAPASARCSCPGPNLEWVSRTGPANREHARPPRDRARAHAAPVRRPLPRQHGAALGGAPTAAGCSCRRTRSTPTPTGRRSRSCAATRTGCRCRRRSWNGSQAPPSSSPFDRLYDNFGRGIGTDARAAVRRSADRYIAWVRGDHDDLT